MNKEKNTDLEIIEAALKDAMNGPVPLLEDPHAGERDRRELEIIFYGMMCFDPLPDRRGYRVLFPNGRDLTALTDIPVHSAALWIRRRGERVTSRWSGLAHRNDFFVSKKQRLTITGVEKTPLDTTGFEGRLTDLRDCDPEFRISDDPDAVIDMIVDHGTLSAHVGHELGMIVVKWRVQVEAGASVRFSFGDDFVEVRPTVEQVVLANVSHKPQMESFRDFQLFRKLSANPDKPLEYKLPKNRPTDHIKVHEPTFDHSHPVPAAGPSATPGAEKTPAVRALRPIVGAVPQSLQEAIAQTPIVVCSAVVSRSITAA